MRLPPSPNRKRERGEVEGEQLQQQDGEQGAAEVGVGALDDEASLALLKPDVDGSSCLGYDLDAVTPWPHDAASLASVGNTCYLNAVLWSLAAVRQVRAWASQHLTNLGAACADRPGGPCALCALAKDLAAMSASEAGSLKPALTTKEVRASIRAIFSGRSQQCALEAIQGFLQAAQDKDERAFDDLQVPCNLAGSKSLPSWTLFGGVLETQLHCASCGGRIQKFDPIQTFSMSIPASTGGGVPDLHAAIDSYLAASDCEADDSCPACGALGQRRASRDILTPWPEVLVLHFIRRLYDRRTGLPVKDPRVVAFPESFERGGQEYSLVGVVVHQGVTATSGHYVAYVRHPGRGWLLCDDFTRPRQVCWSTVAQQQAYFLLYNS